jgi:peptide/nickel transport system permease protein
VIAYIVRRALYAIPVLLGVSVIAFLLFFVVNTPDDMARMFLGQKRVTPQQIEDWKRERGYDRPLFYNTEAQGLGRLADAIFVHKSLGLLRFDFGRSDSGREIGYDIRQRMWPSLAIALLSLLIGVGVNISFALLIAFFRGSYLDLSAVVLGVILMSLSSLSYIILGQFLFSKLMHLVPISGYDSGSGAVRFVILPVMVGVISGIGSGTRWYRTLFLEEIGKDYVRTARPRVWPISWCCCATCSETP